MMAKSNPITRSITGLANRVRGLFRFEAVKSVDVDQVPTLLEIEGRGNRELIHPFGFKAVPRASNAIGDALALTAGTGSDAVAVAVVDARFEPDDIATGRSCMYDYQDHRCFTSSKGVETNCDMTVGGNVDATKYECGGTAGVSGKLVITIAGPGATPGVATIDIKGGIVTSVVGTGNCVWTPTP